ncbi:MAG TPA: 6-pyruvoyl-tetrahydropterin synthase-related protein, partial [Patescibacteria group bacterium]
MVKKILPQIIIFITVILAGFYLFSPGLFPTHDGEYHIIRFYEFSRVLDSGIVYPRWAPDLNNGYGVPLFNFVYPLPNYIASFLHIFSISFIDGFKISMFLALLIGALGMYLFAKEFFGKVGGVVASVCYTFSPYHFVDIYIRGSIGEVWALGLYPWFLFTVTKYKNTKNFFWILISGLIFALIIFSHNILALAFAPFAVLYTFILLFEKKNFLKVLLEILAIFSIGIGLSAIFWLPAILETKYTVGLQVFGIDSNFPDLSQLLIPSWGSGFFGSSLGNEMSVQIGIANLLAILIGLVVTIKSMFKHTKNNHVFIFMIISFFVLLFFMLQISLPLWKIIPLMNYFQFPWRFLSLVILITSFLAGSIVTYFKNILFPIIFILFAIALSFNYTKPAYYMLRNDSYYTSRSNFIDGTNSPGNAFNTIYAKGKLGKQDQKIIYISGTGSLENIHITPEAYLFTTDVKSASVLGIHTAYFIGWKATIDNLDVPLTSTKNGDMTLNIPKGKHSVAVWYSGTFIQIVAAYISLIFAVLVL